MKQVTGDAYRGVCLQRRAEMLHRQQIDGYNQSDASHNVVQLKLVLYFLYHGPQKSTPFI